LRKAKVPGFEKTVPHFVPHLGSNSSQTVTEWEQRESPILVRGINNISNGRIPSQGSAPQLLTEGLLEICPGVSRRQHRLSKLGAQFGAHHGDKWQQLVVTVQIGEVARNPHG
jgi:hypothetical protein